MPIFLKNTTPPTKLSKSSQFLKNAMENGLKSFSESVTLKNKSDEFQF